MRDRVRNMLVVGAIAVAGAATILATVTAPAQAEDKRPRPKPKDTHEYLIIKMVEGIITLNVAPGSDGPLSLQGRLHVVVDTTYDADGNVAERRLHANLMDAFATSVTGDLRLPATGSDSDTRTAQACSPERGCPGDVWTLRFGLPRSGFTLRLATQYDADGALTNVAVLRQDGPPIVG